MVTAVRLTVVTGPHRGERFCFRGPTQCKLGRDPDCFVQLSGTERDKQISRCHCQLEIDLPDIRVCDLGSRNGTCINGKLVGPSLQEIAGQGDLITIGGTTLRIDTLECPHAEEVEHGKRLWEPGETQKRDCQWPC
jgi:hypothetical protein